MRKIFIVCSTDFYDRVNDIKGYLEDNGFAVVLPNCFDLPVTNDNTNSMSEDEYKQFLMGMYQDSRKNIAEVDTILVLNYDKVKNNLVYKNYIGVSTFLEMYEAFNLNKNIYVLNELPDNMLAGDIRGFKPIILKGDITNIIKS